MFDKSKGGTLTAGNSSPLTDGASATVLMSESAAAEHGFEPLAYVKAIEFAAISPDDGLLMGPGVAVPRILRRVGLTLGDIDIIEMHEAFAGQVASNFAAWEHGWKEEPIGKVDRDKLNPLGGSIAIGDPFAATGSRFVNRLAHEMARREARYGLVSICGAGAHRGGHDPGAQLKRARRQRSEPPSPAGFKCPGDSRSRSATLNRSGLCCVLPITTGEMGKECRCASRLQSV